MSTKKNKKIEINDIFLIKSNIYHFEVLSQWWRHHLQQFHWDPQHPIGWGPRVEDFECRQIWTSPHPLSCHPSPSALCGQQEDGRWKEGKNKRKEGGKQGKNKRKEGSKEARKERITGRKEARKERSKEGR